MSKTNVDLNQTSCLVHQQSFGERLVTNLCSGEVTTIPWTLGDWMNAVGLSFLFLILIAAVMFVGFLIVMVILDR